MHVDVDTKSVVTFGEPIEVIHPLNAIFQNQFLEDRYSTGNVPFQRIRAQIRLNPVLLMWIFFQTNHEGCSHHR